MAADLVRCYGALGRSIIFCETKRDCNDLAASLGDAMRARALHGDIPQSQREVRPAVRLIRLLVGGPLAGSACRRLRACLPDRAF